MEIKSAKELGRKGSNYYGWCACVGCGKERWVRLLKGSPVSQRCFSCAGIHRKSYGEQNTNWKGGRKVNVWGYVHLYLYPNDPYYPMTNSSSGYVLEHRLVMAKHLGRLLELQEIVHHRGTKYTMGSIEDRQDNRIENLRLFPNDDKHKGYHKTLREKEKK